MAEVCLSNTVRQLVCQGNKKTNSNFLRMGREGQKGGCQQGQTLVLAHAIFTVRPLGTEFMSMDQMVRSVLMQAQVLPAHRRKQKCL